MPLAGGSDAEATKNLQRITALFDKVPEEAIS
jgi:hypothetical protein